MSEPAKIVLDKGGLAEECLREYFRGLGSYVVRGVPVREGSEDVTDIDLWVYTRATAHSRHVAIVDIKNKRRGQAFERAIWVRGLQAALGANEAIVASQGITEAAQRFSERMGVRVISRPVFDAIVSRYSAETRRLPLEEINTVWRSAGFERTNLKAVMDDARAEISRGISFASLNRWIDLSAQLLRISIDREIMTPGSYTRAAYLSCSLVAVGADFLGRDLSLSDTPARREFFRQGLIFGQTKLKGQNLLEFAESLITEHLDPSGSSAAQVRSAFAKSVEKMPVDGLAEVFARPLSGSELVPAAIALEDECFASILRAPRDLGSVEAKSVVGLVGDFAGIRRRDLLGAKAETQTVSDPSVPQSRLL
jgi:hypothetical protein